MNMLAQLTALLGLELTMRPPTTAHGPWWAWTISSAHRGSGYAWFSTHATKGAVARRMPLAAPRSALQTRPMGTTSTRANPSSSSGRWSQSASFVRATRMSSMSPAIVCA